MSENNFLESIVRGAGTILAIIIFMYRVYSTIRYLQSPIGERDIINVIRFFLFGK